MHELKYKHFVTEDEILRLFSIKAFAEIVELPVSIFDNKELSALEAICKYLKEELGLRYSEIAKLLNRDQRTVWVTYNNSVKKRKQRLVVKDSIYKIPVSIFKDRKFSVLEALVSYLRDNYNLRYIEISKLLNRDERNIWGVYDKAKKKA